jgi:predicted ATP-grasp superfamily ATP-dependent carboligase
MKTHTTSLAGKKVGVVGFNARPIARSLKHSNAQAFVSDYWGDADLRETSSDCIAILSPMPGFRQRQPLDIPVHQALVENFLMLIKDTEIDFVLIGSGFDDNSDALKPIEKRGYLMGNSITRMNGVRDHSTLDKIANALYLQRPKEIVTSFKEAEECIDKIEYPCVIRPLTSGGGSGIRLVRNRTDFKNTIKKRFSDESRFRIQEYITGFDISSSILSSKSTHQCISVQGQLIGMPTAGKNCGFGYCGNYYPAVIPKQIVNRISALSQVVCEKLNLIGSNGLDFVVDTANKIFLMEVNPRLQGTLEMLESAGNISITEAHVRAINGVPLERKPTFKPVVKMIVYSRKDGAVPDLSKFSNVVDRTPKGVIVHQGDPICTIIEVGTSLKESYASTARIARVIQTSVT